MQEARRRVEDQMEKFRDLEKEYKLRKLTKVVFQNHSELENKYKFDSSDSDGSNHRDYSGDYGSSDSDRDSLLEDEPEKTSGSTQETIITVVTAEP